MSATDSWLESWAAIVRAPALGSRALKQALTHMDVEELLGRSSSTLRSLGIGPSAADYLSNPQRSELRGDLQWLAQSGAKLLPCTDREFPPQLAALNDAPPALYVLGDIHALSQPQVAIVGSRTPTAAGRKIAATLARDLSLAGMVVTSGLARGIDTAAHEGALAAPGLTIAVCGTGLDICYPQDNLELAHRIATHGAIVSEFPPGTGPRAQHFPRRNRIISGLSSGVVVVEAAADSGSLITARRALDQGREVFAVPGSPLNPLAVGCLELLREGAHLACTAVDVLAQINFPHLINVVINQLVDPKSGVVPITKELDKDYEMLLDALGFEPASIDDLVDRTGLTPGSVASMMLILELDGRVETRPGAFFNRIAGPNP